MTSHLRTLISLIGVTGLVLLMSACSRSPMKTRYDICIVNKTGQDLDWVCAYYGDTKVAEPGRLVKGGNKTEALITVPVAPEAEVRWDENGAHHAVKVKLEGVVPHGFTYFNLYFIINEDSSVSVKVIKADDIDANAKVIK